MTFAKHIMMIPVYLYISADERLRNFNIIVGPNNGTYKKCGSSTNDMSKGETTAFFCEAHASGISLKITIIGRKQFMILCEVFILGTGMVGVNISIVKIHHVMIGFLKFHLLTLYVFIAQISLQIS